MGRGRYAIFYENRLNRVHEDAERDIAKISELLRLWLTPNVQFATLDSRHVDWPATYELNRRRFAADSERWSLDIEPALNPVASKP